MADFDNTNRGFVAVNDRKENEKHPDYKGSLNVNGVEYWISGWKKTTKAGKKILSLSIQPKDRQSSEPTRKAREDDFDDVPF